MQLRRTELEAVAVGYGDLDASNEGNLLGLADALRKLPTLDRAPLWELAMRRFGRQKPLPLAAGEIGMDPLHASALLTEFAHGL